MASEFVIVPLPTQSNPNVPVKITEVRITGVDANGNQIKVYDVVEVDQERNETNTKHTNVKLLDSGTELKVGDYTTLSVSVPTDRTKDDYEPDDPAADQSVKFLINTGGTGNNKAAQITSLTNGGTTSAYATVTVLAAGNTLSTETVDNVYILPYAEFGEVGDRGILVEYSTAGNTVKYLQLNKQAFMVFNE